MKFPLLTADDIEVKVQKVTDKGAVGVLYKTARTDMRLLDDVVGTSWQDEYREVKGNLYCKISIWDEKMGWVGREDCGVESREDDDNNQKKGEASDAFKRAGTKWGIGRELYTSPFIFLAVPTKARDGGRGYDLANRFTRFEVSHIEYIDNRISALTIIDDKGNSVYQMGKRIPNPTPEVQSKVNDAKKNNPVTTFAIDESTPDSTPEQLRAGPGIPVSKADKKDLAEILEACGGNVSKATALVALKGYTSKNLPKIVAKEIIDELIPLPFGDGA